MKWTNLSKPYIWIEDTTLGGVDDNKKITIIYKYKNMSKLKIYINFLSIFTFRDNKYVRI